MSLHLLSAKAAGGSDRYGVVTTQVACSATVFLLWDVLLNIDDEVRYIWRSPGGWAKWLYLFIRHMPYLAIGSLLLVSVFVSRAAEMQNVGKCRALVAYDIVVAESLMVAVDIILIIRVCAMFNRNRILVAGLLALFLAYITGSCVILSISLPRMEFAQSQCIVIAAPATFSLVWVLALTFETMLFALTLIRLFSWLRVYGRLHGQSIMTVLVRDGVWAYALLFAVLLVNTIMYRTQKNSLTSVAYPWVLAIFSFSGSHVLLNLRKFAIGPYVSLLSDTDTSHLSGTTIGQLSSYFDPEITAGDPTALELGALQ